MNRTSLTYFLLAALCLCLMLVSCKGDEKEEPYEYITFYPLEYSGRKDVFNVHETLIKRYLSESIEDMFIRNDTSFGFKLLGKWIGNDSILFTRLDNNTFTVDTIRRVRLGGTNEDSIWQRSDDSTSWVTTISIMISDNFQELARRHPSGKWDVYDCEKALEAWYKLDSTRSADYDIILNQKNKNNK